MSKNQYLSDSKSPLFATKDDMFLDHRETYMTSGRRNHNSSRLFNTASSSNDVFEGKKQQLLQKKSEIEERTTQSLQTSMSLLKNSECVGAATAEELLRQREQLERTEKKLDEINTTLHFSQKHIQGIKSLFGSLKNYVRRKTGEPSNANRQDRNVSGDINSSSSMSRSSLCDTLSQASSSSRSDHAGLRTLGLTDSSKNDNIINISSSAQEVYVDENLDEIVASVARLKGLARGLGEEIEIQNGLVENIIVKADKADITMQQQNKVIKNLTK